MAAEGRLSVLTWNLWWRHGPWEERLPAIVEVVRELDPDLVALQEVWVDGDRTSAHVVAEALGHHVVVGHRLELDGIGFGNAVLSRWPITGSEAIPLPAGEDEHDEERLVLVADVDSPHGALQLFSTHLNWRWDQSATRQAQVRVLAGAVATRRPRDYPPIVCGDLNAEPDSDEVRMLTGKAAVPVPGLVLFDAWSAANGPLGGETWSDRDPFAAEAFEHDRRIDHVLVGWRRNDGRGKTLACRVVGDEPVGGVWPSDHFGVYAELQA